MIHILDGSVVLFMTDVNTFGSQEVCTRHLNWVTYPRNNHYFAVVTWVTEWETKQQHLRDRMSN